MTISQKQNIEHLRQQGMGCTQIAESLGISANTVKSFCRRNNITVRTDTVTTVHTESEDISNNDTSNKTISCKQCGKPLAPVSKTKPKTFCCDKCRFDWWNANRDKIKNRQQKNCVHCGAAFETKGNGERKFCGHSCYIAHRYGRGTRRDEGAV